MGEFDLIERYFTRPARHAVLGVGDDCALLAPASGMQLALSTDMLVEGRHFLSTVNPVHLGHKALAVNLSDLAACGARPRAFLLSLALPRIDEVWLAGFAQGLWALADAFGCELIGGDTTQGPLNISITVVGETPQGQALLRSGAQAGDDIYVSGHLGDARVALEVFRGSLSVPSSVFNAARIRMEQPTPRVALGLALRGIATAAADISDGLLGDLSHILKASQVGATLDSAAALSLLACATEFELPPSKHLQFVLTGGDDYELVFTAPASKRAEVHAAGLIALTRLTRIGQICAEPGLTLLDTDGQPMAHNFVSFDHFA
ncbi:thiamine-phosphate kinase [Limnohabitans sp. Rim8]|uniref:thiamine-phosphate kinase n=1 Tax=Limnohabitans sp. Rim8 TaxID=1100718 RepID=UPI0033068786